MRQVVLIPDLEDGGCTVEEALENIKDAIEGYIAALRDDGLPVPP